MSVREYKSNVFAMLMEVPEYALEVYNALNGTSYTDETMIQIQKLESGVSLSVKNDASFLLDSYMNLYEHQASSNPNMPLRFLIYFSTVLKQMVKKRDYDLYGKKRIPIPTPKFVVFYNGTEERPEKETMCLSESFLQKDENYQLELTCDVYNINPGNNKQVMEQCRVLSGYTSFVEYARKKINDGSEIKDAVEDAVDYCIDHEILKEFFLENREEIKNMAALDFTFERREELIRRDSYEEGITVGIERGIEQGIERGIIVLIETVMRFHATEEEALQNAMEEYPDKTEEEIRLIWEGYKMQVASIEK